MPTVIRVHCNVSRVRPTRIYPAPETWQNPALADSTWTRRHPPTRCGEAQISEQPQTGPSGRPNHPAHRSGVFLPPDPPPPGDDWFVVAGCGPDSVTPTSGVWVRPAGETGQPSSDGTPDLSNTVAALLKRVPTDVPRGGSRLLGGHLTLGPARGVGRASTSANRACCPAPGLEKPP